jgi:hypothetical protein
MTAHRVRPPLLWSKGISRYCDCKGPVTYWLKPTESCQTAEFFEKYYGNASGIVWVRLSTCSKYGERCDLDNFVRGALPTIHSPFILVTTDGDSSVPGDIPRETMETLLTSPWLVAWYTQNLDGYRHTKLKPFPIGIDLHTPRFTKSARRIASELKRLRGCRMKPEDMPLRVFCDLEVNLNSKERERAVSVLQDVEHVDFQSERISQADIWRRYIEYPFVMSAPGNGLDCHRTWELLYLGVIVITKKSPLDSLFEGLPVVTVDEWVEVASRDNLEQWLQQYGELTEKKYVWNRLDPRRLVREIREKLDTA